MFLWQAVNRGINVLLFWSSVESWWLWMRRAKHRFLQSSLRTKLHRPSTSISIYLVKRRLLRFQRFLNFSGSLRAQKGCHTIPLEGLSNKRGRPQQIKHSNQLWWAVEPYEGGLSSRDTCLKLSLRKLCLLTSLSASDTALTKAISLQASKSLF